MSLSLLLLWFPIMLAVAAAGRLLGRSRGLTLGFLCALFWIALVQATAGAAVWGDFRAVGAVLAGAAAVTLVGGWSGQVSHAGSGASGGAYETVSSHSPRRDSLERSFLSSIGKALGRFDGWLENTSCSRDPWADFGEYLRTALFETLGARHVHPFRLVSDGAQLEPLHGAGVMGTKTRVASGEGLMGRVLATGVSYVAGVDAPENSYAELVEPGLNPPGWCFAVTRGKERLGVITVGRIDVSPAANPEAAYALERLVGQVWSVFVDKLNARSANITDSTSMLATRDAFMRDANIALRESYALGEPVAIAVLATQGLRRLTDAGRWEIADDVLHTIGGVMRRRVRLDDCLGRIDEARVVWLLRRVDGNLAKLVVGQLVSHVGEAVQSCHAAAEEVRVDCGVACSASDEVPLRALLVRALEATRRARSENRVVFFGDGDGSETIRREQEVGGAL